MRTLLLSVVLAITFLVCGCDERKRVLSTSMDAGVIQSARDSSSGLSTKTEITTDKFVVVVPGCPTVPLGKEAMIHTYADKSRWLFIPELNREYRTWDSPRSELDNTIERVVYAK